jgi:hypothetical protein
MISAASLAALHADSKNPSLAARLRRRSGSLAADAHTVPNVQAGESGTFRRLFEPMLAAGFSIVTVTFDSSLYGACTCLKTRRKPRRRALPRGGPFASHNSGFTVVSPSAR